MLENQLLYNYTIRIFLIAFISLYCASASTLMAQDSTGRPVLPATEAPSSGERQPVTNNPTPTRANTQAVTPRNEGQPAVRQNPAVPANPSATRQVPPAPANNQAATPTPNSKPTTGANPFELVKNGNAADDITPRTRPQNTRTDTTSLTSEDTSQAVPKINTQNNDERTVAIDPNNPFELVKNGNVGMFGEERSEGTVIENDKKSITPKAKFNKKRKKIFDLSGLNIVAMVKFLGLLLMAGILSFLTNNFRYDLQKIYRAFSNSNMMTQLYREKGSLLTMPYIPLYLLFAFTGGIFIYLSTLSFKVSIVPNQGLSLLLCIIAVGSFYLLKHLLLKAMSVIFPFKKEINQYHFLIGIFNQMIGLALIPIVVLVAFAPDNIKLFAIYSGLAVIAIIMINRLIRSVIIASKFIAFHKFHLIVYICAVEIAPIFIILKCLMR